MLRRPRSGARVLRIQIAVLAALTAAGTAGLVFPGLIPVVPRFDSVASNVVFLLGAPMLLALAYRAGRTFLLTRRTSDVLVAVGVVLLAGAEYGLLEFGMMDLGWWAAHAFEVAGIGLVGIPAALDLRHSTASRPLVGDLRAADVVADEEAFLGGRVHALLLRLAEKDGSTEGHTRRVATLAVQIGEHLQLAPARLRLLALGGLLHDMGKLAVPDADPQQAGQAHRRGVRGDQGPPGRRPRAAERARRLPRARPRPGREPPRAPRRPRLSEQGRRRQARRSRSASSPSPTSTTRSPPTASTARRGRSSAPLALLDEDTGSAFDATCVAALKAVVAPEQDDGHLARLAHRGRDRAARRAPARAPHRVAAARGVWPAALDGG